MTRVFVSHSSEDRPRVESQLVDLLRREGMESFYSRDDIAITETWQQRIRAELDSCDWFIVALSPAAVVSEHVRDEVHFALERMGGRVVPVLLEPCDPTWCNLRLERLQHVDFTADLDGASRRLLATLRDRAGDATVDPDRTSVGDPELEAPHGIAAGGTVTIVDRTQQPTQKLLATRTLFDLRPRLIYKHGRLAGRKVMDRLTEKSGRGEESTVRIQDGSVSRNHASISFDGGRFVLRDLGSAGGTWVNDRRVAAGADCEVPCHALVRFGAVDAIFMWEDPEHRAQARRLQRRAARQLVAERRISSEVYRAAIQLEQKKLRPIGETLLLDSDVMPSDWARAVASVRSSRWRDPRIVAVVLGLLALAALAYFLW